jgi:hypothetical protein
LGVFKYYKSSIRSIGGTLIEFMASLKFPTQAKNRLEWATHPPNPSQAASAL